MQTRDRYPSPSKWPFLNDQLSHIISMCALHSINKRFGTYKIYY